MKKKISYYLGQEGYLKMVSNLPEFVLYFKKEHGFVSLIEVVDLEQNPYMTEDAIHDVTRKAKWRFMDQGFNEIHCLVVVLTKSIEKAISFGKKETFYWLVDTDKEQLVIPEGKAEDFYGMKGMIETWIKADGAQVEQQMTQMDQIQFSTDGTRAERIYTRPLITEAIFIVNLIIFAFCSMFDGALYEYGVLSLADVLSGDVYRILTALFMHGSLSHLFSNILMLVIVGEIVEREIGHGRFLLLYSVAGIAASAGSLLCQYLTLRTGGEVYSSVGASGAIFGLLGALMYIIIKNKGHFHGMSVVRVLLLICYLLYMGFVGTGVDNAAHVFGLLGGFIAGIFLYHKEKPKEA